MLKKICVIINEASYIVIMTLKNEKPKNHMGEQIIIVFRLPGKGGEDSE